MRIETTTRTLYLFDELSDNAKDVARDWFITGMFDYDWWSFQYEDAENIGLKITEFDVERGTIGGKLVEDVSSVCDLIRKNHGKTCGTYKLAQEYKATDTEANNYDDIFQEFKHALLEEYLSMLRAEVEYMKSNESIDENIRANEYEFTEDGKRA